MKRGILIIGISIIVIAAIALWPTESVIIVQPETKTFDILITHTRYIPNVVEVNQNDVVVLNLRTEPGTAGYMHGITIAEYNINQLVTTEDKPTVVRFTADKKGTFRGYCGTCANGPFGRDAPDKRLTLIVN